MLGFVNSSVCCAMAESIKFKTTITCPTCSQTGSLQWEEGSGGGRERGGTRIYISVSEGFQLSEIRAESYDYYNVERDW